MEISIKTLPFILIVLMFSCKNQTKENGSTNADQIDSVSMDTQKAETKDSRIDKNRVVNQLQGKWKEIEYPYRTTEFVSSTVKFVEEGTASKTKFEKYEISEVCTFENNNIKDLTSNDIILSLPETQRCEKLKISSDTLTLSGFSTNSDGDYNIVYLKLK